jgi:hypothetical protein
MVSATQGFLRNGSNATRPNVTLIGKVFGRLGAARVAVTGHLKLIKLYPDLDQFVDEVQMYVLVWDQIKLLICLIINLKSDKCACGLQWLLWGRGRQNWALT